MKGRYSRGSSESYLDSDLNILKNDGSFDELLEQLKLHVRDFRVSESELRFKNRRSPYFSLLFLISKQNGIKDWFSGLALSEKMTGKAHAVQFHHIMPKSLLRDLGYDSKYINDIANLTFIGGKTNRNISNKLPSKYLADIVEKQGTTIYKSNHIPEDRTLWEIENYDTFLEFRRKAIVSQINEFISKYNIII
jgi:hypothetical protein